MDLQVEIVRDDLEELLFWEILIVDVSPYYLIGTPPPPALPTSPPRLLDIGGRRARLPMAGSEGEALTMVKLGRAIIPFIIKLVA